MTSFLISVKIAFAVAGGFFVLAPACALHAWTEPTYPSIKPYADATPPAVGKVSRPMVDEWKWQWLNTWYANPEDGVSGQQAWIWDDKGNLIPYSSTFPKWVPKSVIAYFWNSRNNANNIKRPYRGDAFTQPWTPKE